MFRSREYCGLPFVIFSSKTYLTAVDSRKEISTSDPKTHTQSMIRNRCCLDDQSISVCSKNLIDFFYAMALKSLTFHIATRPFNKQMFIERLYC
jgi:hypothetical protein